MKQKVIRFGILCACALLPWSGASALAAAEADSDENKPVLLRPPMWVDADDKNIPEPPERDASEIYDVVRNSWFRHLDIGYKGLEAADRPALNVNAWDEVPDSSWFQNRIGRRTLTRAELTEGAPGLAPQPGKWWILRLKTAGYTPGVHFRDPAGERFVLKFDLPEAPERNSAADKIGSLLVYAAGYNAPHNSIVSFHPEDLELDEQATFEDLLGRKRPMTRDDLEQALARLAPRPDGTLRALASHYIRGVPKGYFPYWGVREDDPNDIIPHELRRELRGFRIIASWFNHVDTKEVNTFDTYVSIGGRSFLKHYFIDFGSTMGSGDFMNGPKRVGHEYLFDGPSMLKSFVTFGAWQRPWEAACEVIHPEVGHFEAALFSAADWKPNYPNLAFQEMDAADAYWGAKIVTSFGDDHLRALAEAGEYSRAEVTRYVEDVFRARRDRIGEYWLTLVTPLEAFELETDAIHWTVRFRDLAVERGYASTDRSYRFTVKDTELKTMQHGFTEEVGVLRFRAPSRLSSGRTDRWNRTPMLILDITSQHSDGSSALPVRLVLGRDGDASLPGAKVLGWAHASR